MASRRKTTGEFRHLVQSGDMHSQLDYQSPPPMTDRDSLPSAGEDAALSRSRRPCTLATSLAM